MCIFAVKIHQEMEDKKGNTKKQRAKMEFTARITMPDGRVVEKTVEVDGGAPIGELDLSNVDAFVKVFDGFEKSIIRADNEMKTGILDEYMSVLEGKKREGSES